jgi:integrase/recombinase XerD
VADLKDQKYTTHKLRGSFCTNAYKKGAGIRELQILMGHKNINTTQRYLDYDEESLRSAVTNIYD